MRLEVTGRSFDGTKLMPEVFKEITGVFPVKGIRKGQVMIKGIDETDGKFMLIYVKPGDGVRYYRNNILVDITVLSKSDCLALMNEITYLMAEEVIDKETV